MRLLLNNKKLFPDVTFIVEGRPLLRTELYFPPVDQFHAMFMSGMKEQRVEIQIPNWSHDAFLSMLEFLYTDPKRFHSRPGHRPHWTADQYTLAH